MEIIPIRTEKDYRAALRLVATLVDQDPSPDTPDGERLDVLSTLIEAYEQKHHAIDSPDKGGINVKSLKDVKAEQLANPAVRQAYDAQAPEFELARELIAARTKAGLTQGDVAALMGTTQSVVARIESGRGTPSMRTVQRFASAVGARAVVRMEPLTAA
jgi:antitoxin component HigA of HigAB toxin-antitoxin module